jgi:hypothetical protein
MKCWKFNQISVVWEGFFWVALVCELLWNHKTKPNPSSLSTGPHFTHTKGQIIHDKRWHWLHNRERMQWTTSSPWFTNQAHPITKSRFDPIACWSLFIPVFGTRSGQMQWLEFGNSAFSVIWTRSHIWIWLGRLEGFKLQRRSLITNSRLMIIGNLYLIDHASSWMLQLKLNGQFHKSAYNPKYDI